MDYVHNLSPFAIQFTETFGIRWYGLAYLSGFISGYYTILLMSRRGGTKFTPEMIADFTTYSAIGVLGGGRLGYCLFYAPELFSSVDSHFPYWGVLKVNEGGMASHGGILGVMAVCYFYARSKKIPILHVMDMVVLGGSVGFFFGRIANFINGELYGREAPAGLKWAVRFPQEIHLWLQKDFGKMKTLGPALDALKQFKTETGEMISVNAQVWQGWLEGYLRRDLTLTQHVHEAIDALIKATQVHNEAVTQALSTILTPRYPSQLIQAVLEGLLVFIILCWIWRKPQKPGVVGGWFGFFYCVARIVGEQFRMPDSQIGFQLWGLTRGQWLSVGLLCVAVVWLVYCYRQTAEELGGWRPAGKT